MENNSSSLPPYVPVLKIPVYEILQDLFPAHLLNIHRHRTQARFPAIRSDSTADFPVSLFLFPARIFLYAKDAPAPLPLSHGQNVHVSEELPQVSIPALSLSLQVVLHLHPDQ